MKWVKVAIGAVIAILSIGIITTSVYDLTQPEDSAFYNGYTLREVFQNRNMGKPNLSGMTNLGGGNYRYYDKNGITVDYNVNNGVWTINGTTTLSSGDDIIYNLVPNQTYTMSYISVGGTLTGGALSIFATPPPLQSIQQTNENVDKQLTFTAITQERIRFDISPGRTFTNYQFKLQLEIGDTVTPYQVPTNGPYNDIDVGQFDLTPEQIQTYYDLYLETKPAVLTGVTATLILLTPLVFAGGVLAYLLNKQNY